MRVLVVETFMIRFESNLKEAAWFVGVVYYLCEFGVFFCFGVLSFFEGFFNFAYKPLLLRK